MTTLQNKENKFLWKTKCGEIFHKIKQLLTTALLLRIADPDGVFVVCKTLSKEELNGVLMQNDCTIFYESRKLMEHKFFYPTHDIELASITHDLKMWSPYLIGKKFFVKIDNMNLKYFFNHPDLNAR